MEKTSTSSKLQKVQSPKNGDLGELLVQKIRDLFLERRKKNSAYSLRAFSRDLGMSHTLLSLIFNGSRRLSERQILKILPALNLSAKEERAVLRQTQKSRSPADPNGDGNSSLYSRVEMDRFRLISDWKHLAILELTELRSFSEDFQWISQVTKINAIEARDILERLLRLGLLERSPSGRLKKAKSYFHFVSDIPNVSIREFHKSAIDRARLELTDRITTEDVLSRWIGGGTFAIRDERVSDAREALRRFQDAFIAEYSDFNADQVYQISLQCFSLTPSLKVKKKEGPYEKK
jgi:uncharacterized protein (TIGR02147 family)